MQLHQGNLAGMLGNTLFRRYLALEEWQQILGNNCSHRVSNSWLLAFQIRGKSKGNTHKCQCLTCSLCSADSQISTQAHFPLFDLQIHFIHFSESRSLPCNRMRNISFQVITTYVRSKGWTEASLKFCALDNAAVLESSQLSEPYTVSF